MYPSREMPHYGVFVQNCEKMLRDEGNQVDHVVITYQKNRLRKLLCYLRFFMVAAWRGKTNNYDCVYAHYASHVTPVIGYFRRFCPEMSVVVNVHGNDIVPVSASEQKNPKRSRKTLDRCNLVIAPSAYFKRVLMENYHIREKMIAVFPSGGVNCEIFYPQDKKEARNALQLPQEGIVAGFAARLEPYKGWDIFLKAFAVLSKKYPDLTFVLAGEGSQEKECDEMIQRLGVQEKGRRFPLLSQKKLAQCMNAVDFFCVSSVQESLGLVGLEAMACGTPCVLSAIPGIQEFARDQINCLTFEPGNAADLVKKTERLLQFTSEQKNKMKQEQLLTAREYSMEKLKKQLSQIFDNM